MQETSLAASRWNSKFGQPFVSLVSRFVAFFGFTVLDSFLSVHSSDNRLLFVKNAFYKPFVIIRNRAYWGPRSIPYSTQLIETSANLILNNDAVSSRKVVPVGFVLSRVIPQSEYSLVRDSDSVTSTGSERWVLLGDPTLPRVKVEAATQSYFHFLLETLPLLLEHLDSKALLVPILQDWQISILRNLGLDFTSTLGEQTFHSWTVRKSQWGMYPREKDVIELKKFFSRQVSTPNIEKESRLFVTRNTNTSRTGRIPSLALLQTCQEQLELKAVDPANSSFQSQLQLFSGASVIVAPHGSALASIVAARELRGVLEIFPRNRVSFHIEYLARVLGVPYRAMLVEQDPQGYLQAPSQELMDLARTFLERETGA